MNRGYLINAQQSGRIDYVLCAVALAKSIRRVMPHASVTLLTDSMPAPPRAGEFDNVVLYPWGDTCRDDEWKLANDWQVFWASPYDYTIKLEADMIIPTDIDWWWDTLEPYDIQICSTIRRWTGEISTSTHYREVFNRNLLPPTYNAITYFTKSEQAERFYTTVKDIFQQWSMWRRELGLPPNEIASTDLVYAIAALLCGESNTVSKQPYFSMIHMKQYIANTSQTQWDREFIWEITPHNYKINTVPQLYPLHYHVKNWAPQILDLI
jgi:hypothetical protein